MNDAVWGVFEEGWRSGFGADADHLKTFEDIDRTVDAGFTFFTVDPSAYVDNEADTDDEATLRAKAERIPGSMASNSGSAMAVPAPPNSARRLKRNGFIALPPLNRRRDASERPGSKRFR